MIKNQQKEAQDRRQREFQEKQMRTKMQIEDKAFGEEQRRLEHEALAQKMEQEELELIQRLQNTQLLQRAAYEDLESALTGGQADSKKGTAKNGTRASKR